ncbi:hypothetical protein ABT340_15740 [Streptosporangium sp. NPDC000239]|uniref:hypothetical protein n=1 Tax=Streptosporangium sp. NPDC000239 TaxID=3154248 RepID=UPI00331F7E19
MKHLTKILIVTQVLTLGALAYALISAYGPPDEDELRRSLFYANGRQAAIVMDLDVPVKNYATCTEALAHSVSNVVKGPEWSRPKGDADEEAFLLGCKEQLLEKAQ